MQSTEGGEPMTRNLKALGLALVTAFAMSAVLAAGAQANGTLSVDVGGGGSANLTGEQISHNGVTHHSFNTFFGSETCTSRTFEGTTTQGNTELTIEPTSSGCTVNGKPATTTMNGCDYEFKGGNATHEPNKAQDHFVESTMRFNCPPGVNGAEFHIYSDAGHINTICTYTILEFAVNQFKGENTWINNTSASPDDIELTTTVIFSVQRTVGPFIECGSVNQTSTYTGATTYRAYKHGLTHNVTNQLSLTLTDPTPPTP
jgi:hypothetical protein